MASLLLKDNLHIRVYVMETSHHHRLLSFMPDTEGYVFSIHRLVGVNDLVRLEKLRDNKEKSKEKSRMLFRKMSF